jgi:hypothetical protein
VRALSRDGPSGEEHLLERTGIETKEDLYRVIAVLEKEQMVAESEGIYRIKG